MTQRTVLEGATVYLSGPMDFVASREEERRNGWRARLHQVLDGWGVRVFDPWEKPLVRNLGRYGLEDETSTESRQKWRFDDTTKGAAIRSSLSGAFWPVMHIDLRMVDLSDFIIACCPTNLYSVGTPHEIVVARQQRKPVLLISPPVRYPRWRELKKRLAGDPQLAELLESVEHEVVVLENPTGTPSQWYTTLVGSESFFDGFGWAGYKDRFGWPDGYLDAREGPGNTPKRPLLPFLEGLRNGKRPQRWDGHLRAFRDNDDWVLLERKAEDQANQAADDRKSPVTSR